MAVRRADQFFSRDRTCSTRARARWWTVFSASCRRLRGSGLPITTARRLLASMTTCRFVE
ncbi:hypothetical protein AV521_10920 [Streptomyces sp. IMTB 2501]|nr:hypothetical protein AV521_10920 [Streptomyces sp. IMTB 2501]